MNTEQKTIREWFLEAKEQGHEWADKALANTDERTLVKHKHDARGALLSAFVWMESPEGRDYWENSYYSL